MSSAQQQKKPQQPRQRQRLAAKKPLPTGGGEFGDAFK